MNSVGAKKVLLCYIDGFDIRSVNASNTPFISDALKTYPYVQISSPPSADAVPTLLTGTYPHEHGMWGVRLIKDIRPSCFDNVIDKIPDIITTTVQCIVQLFTGSFDLPMIPPKRRRCFEALRTQHNKYYQKTENLLNIEGITSCLGVLGIKNSKYLFSRTKPSEHMIEKVASGNYLLEILQIYSIDIVQRWNIDKPDKITYFFKQIDDFINNLFQKCHNKNINLILFSDHGYDKVNNYINIKEKLDSLKLSKDEYKYFVELSMARFWFHTNDARSKIIEMLVSIDNTTVLKLNDLITYNIRFTDDKYGEAFIMTHPGYVFFPHDFHQPIANLCMGLTDSRQFPRVFNPVHRGDHCLLPKFESSKGFLIVFDKNLKTKSSEANLTDVAPTLLDILGYKSPNTMKGSSIFGTRYENNL